MLLDTFIFKKEGIENKILELNGNKTAVLDSKLELLKFIFAGFENSDLEQYEVRRLSKRHKNYVTLSTQNDFREFRRSLKVKNRAKILVLTVPKSKSPVSEFNGLQLVNSLLESFTNGFERSMQPDGIINTQEHRGHSMRSANHTHENISCNFCKCSGPKSISGVRYKCIICKDYDLCSNCYLSGKTPGSHEISHPMIAVNAPHDLVRWGSNSIIRDLKATNELEGSNVTKAPYIEDNPDEEPSFGEQEASILQSSSHTTPSNKTEDAKEKQTSENSTSLEFTCNLKKGTCAEVSIKNTSNCDFNIDGYRLSIDSASFLGSSTIIEQTHDIKPKRSLKLNIRTNVNCSNYPINITLSKESSSGMCQISSASNCGMMLLTKFGRSSSLEENQHLYSSIIAPKIELAQVEDSVHALILPNIEKESSNRAKDSANTTREAMAEDYDLISVTDADELLSDFEILSRVNSIQL